MSRKVALSIEGLKVRYGSIEAIKVINIDVYEGSVVALLGANGAGKTTTLQTISGLVPASEGKIKFYDQDITNMDAEKIAGLGIAQSPEGRQIFGDLTVAENLKVGAFTLKDKKIINQCYERVYRHFPLLKERSKQQAGTLSGGELQMLAIARGLMSNPKAMLIDEPSLGLAPNIVLQVLETLKQLTVNGVSILLVEQNVNTTLKVTDRAYVLEDGRVVLSGNSAELLASDHIQKAYLGI